MPGMGALKAACFPWSLLTRRRQIANCFDKTGDAAASEPQALTRFDGVHRKYRKGRLVNAAAFKCFAL